MSKRSCDEMAVKCSDDTLPQKKSIYHGSQSSVDFVSTNRIDMTECISDINIKNGETQEKAMSLSTLMSGSASHQGLSMSGNRTKNSQVFTRFSFIAFVDFQPANFIATVVLFFQR